MPIDAAVLVIDMQNGFVHPEGSFSRLACEPPLEREAVIEQNVALLAAARQARMPVIHTAHGSLLITGVGTHACVESTARSADMRDFDVTIATDAVGAPAAYHHASLVSMSGVGIRQLPWREALAQAAAR